MPLVSTLGGCSARNYGARLKPKFRVTQISAIVTIERGYGASEFPLEVDEGCGGIIYSISPPLPTGLTLNTSTGEISGALVEAGPESGASYHTIRVIDDCGQIFEWSFTLITTPTTSTTNVDLLVVGGGGAGADGDNFQNGGGGGGAGGFYTGTQAVTPGKSYAIVIGAGGARATNLGGAGGNTTFEENIWPSAQTFARALGGGGGGINQNGGSGGSGGGTSRYPYVGGAATQPTSEFGGYGNKGGDADPGNGPDPTAYGAGGGGGAGAAGSPVASTLAGGGDNGGNGGVGRANPFPDTAWGALRSGNYYLAGGGGGGAGTGVSGGRSGLYITSAPNGTGYGDGGATLTNGRAAQSNYGGGGGGGGRGTLDGITGFVAGNGGSGVVIIRELATSFPATTTGSPTVVVSGSYRYYIFTGDGTITPFV